MRRILSISAVGAFAALTAVLLLARRNPAVTLLEGVAERRTVPVVTATGGIVTEVLTREGARVRKDEVIVRLDDPELRAYLRDLERTEQLRVTGDRRWKAAARTPAEARAMFLQMHPDRQRAESDYVAALGNYDRAAPEERAAAKARLDRASDERTRVARELSDAFPRAGTVAPAFADLRKRVDMLRSRVDDLNVKAPLTGSIDLLQLRPGDRVLPGRPVALLGDESQVYSDLMISAPARVFAVMPDGERLPCRTEPLPGRHGLTALETRPMTRVLLPGGKSIEPGTVLHFAVEP
jgi:multidrug resistance efflux pump